MTFPTAEDIMIRYDGIVQEGDDFMIQIGYGSYNEMESLKQQILLEHEIVERLKEFIKNKNFGNCNGCYPLWYWLDENHKSILENK